MEPFQCKERRAFLPSLDHLDISFSHVGLHRKRVLAEPCVVSKSTKILTERP